MYIFCVHELVTLLNRGHKSPHTYKFTTGIETLIGSDASIVSDARDRAGATMPRRRPGKPPSRLRCGATVDDDSDDSEFDSNDSE
jgi:hypothetical protein